MFFYKALYLFKLAEYRLSMWLDKAMINWRLKNHSTRPIQVSEIKTILLVRNDGIGDMVITTGFIRVLAEHGYQVSVMSQPSALDIIKNNPHVSQTFAWNDNYTPAQMAQLEKQIQAQHFDLIIDMRYPIYFKRSPHRLKLPYYLGGKYIMGWNKSALGFYDVSIKHYTRRGHYVTLIRKFLDALGIQNADLSYEFFIDPATDERAKEFVAQLRAQKDSTQTDAAGPVIVLNPFTGHHRRDMTLKQIQQTIHLLLEKYPKASIVAIGIKPRIEPLIKSLNLPAVVYFETQSILDVAPLIKCADLVISPDTSIIHLVAAYQKPLVGMYASGRRTPRGIASAKMHVKEKYHETVDEMRAHFFDKPHVQQGLRPKGKMLLVEGAFGPNNPNAIQLKNYTHRLSEIPSQAIFEASAKLLDKTY